MAAGAKTQFLLKNALSLVPKYGFTREALANSALESTPTYAPIFASVSSELLRPLTSHGSERYTHTHTEPLSDAAISALFGAGDKAERKLIKAWLDEGIAQMKTAMTSDVKKGHPSVRDVLQWRLKYNEPVLKYLPQAYALLASPSSGLPLLDPYHALKNNARIADEACFVGQDKVLHWYARRASLAVIYGAAELHQLASPSTAPEFLDSLLQTSANVKKAIEEVGIFSGYFFKSWKGIIKSSGLLW